jgi:hypothetical protein
MAKYTILVRRSPAAGYVWKVIADGKVQRTGIAPTEFEARTAADVVREVLEAEEAAGGSPQ